MNEDNYEQYCTWEWLEQDVWATSCTNLFVLNDGTPADNKMKYCCYCGKELKLAIGVEPTTD
jgi:hypothetical protein